MLDRANIKEYLNIDSGNTDYQDALNRLISAAEAWIVNYINQNLAKTSRDYLFSGKNQYYKNLPNFPIITINSLKYRETPLISWDEVDSSNYALVNENGVYWLYLDTTFISGSSVNYKVNYDYGYDGDANIPNDIKQTGIELVSIMFKESDIFEGVKTGRLGVDSITENVAGIATTTKFKNKLNDWKRRLEPYRKVTV